MQETNHIDILRLPSLFVTGTDTEVGKTAVSGALACTADEKGLPWHYFKPAESGAFGEDSDSGCIAKWTGRPDRTTVGYQLSEPLAPLFAAEHEGISLSMQRLDELFHQVTHNHPLIVEGAGGIMTPYTEHVTALELARRWKLPTVIVAANRLGCLNHTLLTIQALEHAGIFVAGCVFNDVSRLTGPSQIRNPKDFQQRSPIPLLAWLPYLNKDEVPSAAWWQAGVERATAISQRETESTVNIRQH